MLTRPKKKYWNAGHVSDSLRAEKCKYASAYAATAAELEPQKMKDINRHALFAGISHKFLESGNVWSLPATLLGYKTSFLTGAVVAATIYPHPGLAMAAGVTSTVFTAAACKKYGDSYLPHVAMQNMCKAGGEKLLTQLEILIEQAKSTR